MVVSCNFLDCERPDLQLPAKEASRSRSKMRTDDDEHVCISNDLDGGVCIANLPFGPHDGKACAYPDVDWAVCPRATGGGVFCMWGYMIKHGPSINNVIACSSAEA